MHVCSTFKFRLSVCYFYQMQNYWTLSPLWIIPLPQNSTSYWKWYCYFDEPSQRQSSHDQFIPSVNFSRYNFQWACQFWRGLDRTEPDGRRRLSGSHFHAILSDLIPVVPIPSTMSTSKQQFRRRKFPLIFCYFFLLRSYSSFLF